MKNKKTEETASLQRKIADIKDRMPAHSVKPEMFQELEELEEELAKLLRRKGETE